MRNCRLGSLNRHKKTLVAAILCIFILYQSLPAVKFTRVPTEEFQRRPHYLHQSTFRTNPDIEFESILAHELQNIERTHRAPQHADAADATDTIWQIILSSKDARKDDSYKLEERNPEWKYQLINADWADNFITETFASIPDLAYLYASYPHFVQRGDILRYLILWYYGGYYADSDVYPAKSIRTCPSLHPVFNDAALNANISLVVGIEIDEPFASPQKMHDWHWARRYGFLQYNIYAPQRFSPILREVIVRVLSHTRQHIESHYWVRYDEMTTLELTGPGVFTDVILDVLSDTLPPTHPLVEKSVDADEHYGDLVPLYSTTPVRRVTWAPFHDVKETLCVGSSEAQTGKMMGGICILPVNAWANGQRHSGSEAFNSQHSCINHRFGGTWKPWKQGWKKYLFG